MWEFKQVQEKKIKKICDINTDSSRPQGNGSDASSSNSNSTNSCFTNGGLPDKVNNFLSNDYSFPPGGIPSLQLPAVVDSTRHFVLSLSFVVWLDLSFNKNYNMNA